MTRTVLTLALTLVAITGVHAQRPMKVFERAYELELAAVVFPIVRTGTVTVKPCGTCDSVVHSVDASTTYLLNRTAVPFEDFTQMVDTRRRVQSGRTTSVAVFYDTDTERVTRILLSYAAQ